MANIIIYGIIVITSLLLYFVKQRYGYWKKLGVPHEEPRLFMGNAQGLMKTRSLGDLFLHTYEKFKGTAPFCGFYMLFKPMAVILDINLVKNVLIKDFSNFTDHGFYTNVEDDPLTGHLFSLEGQKWKTMRTKLTPTFTSGKMKFMFPTILKVADEFVQVFDEMLDKNGNEIEVKEFLARFTTDVIGTCAFGIECNSLRDPNAEFRKMGKATFTERRHGAMGTMIINSFPNLAKKLHMKITTDKVEKFFMNIVRETVDYRRKHNIQRNDFLNILMDLNKESKGDDALTLEEMAAQAFVFFLAGFETSSSTMSFALYELAMHQQEQDRLRKEILETEEKYGLTYESIKSITYLNMVIQGK